MIAVFRARYSPPGSRRALYRVRVSSIIVGSAVSSAVLVRTSCCFNRVDVIGRQFNDATVIRITFAGIKLVSVSTSALIVLSVVLATANVAVLSISVLRS